ncbi:MAG: cellulose binding domain-containing protein, partial [Cyanobacteriota bacterium]
MSLTTAPAPTLPVGLSSTAPLAVRIGGRRWHKGFTAELTLTNSGSQDLEGWSLSFTTRHRISGTPWGATVSGEELGNGLIRYTLTGSGWGARLRAGASITVGFNGRQGVAIGDAGALSADQLLAPVTPVPVTPA